MGGYNQGYSQPDPYQSPPVPNYYNQPGQYNQQYGGQQYGQGNQNYGNQQYGQPQGNGQYGQPQGNGGQYGQNPYGQNNWGGK